MVVLLTVLFGMFGFTSSQSSPLRLNHVQVKGSRNSYHLRPDHTVPQWEFNHESIAAQLDQGIYALEYDFYYEGGQFATAQHFFYDQNTTCLLLLDCLQDIKKWHDAQSRKPILWVALGNKEVWTEEQWAEHDAVVLSVWNESQLIRPDDLRGNFSTVQQAIFTNGWPTLSEAAGKIIIILDQFETLEYYQGPHARLEGRVAFPYFPWENRTHPNAVILKMNVPHPNITIAAQEGFLVRTRSDANLPTYLRAAQNEVNDAYYDVIDLNNDTIINRTEMIYFTVYGATNGIQTFNFSTDFVDQLLVLCSQDNQTLNRTEFDCYQINSNYSIYGMVNYSTLPEAYLRQELGLQVGSHHISSDYPTLGTGQNDSYFLNMGNNSFMVICNPITTTNNSNQTNSTSLPFCDLQMIADQYYSVSPPKDWTVLITLVSVIGGTMLILLAIMLYYRFSKQLKACCGPAQTNVKGGKEYVTLDPKDGNEEHDEVDDESDRR